MIETQRRQKSGGRKKGSENIFSKEIKTELKEIILSDIEKYKSTGQKRYIDAISKLLPYVLPRPLPETTNNFEPVQVIIAGNI